MTTITTDQLLSSLHWRYATKAFDPARKISAATWAGLEEALVLAPSSFGIQPWRFLVVRDPALRARLQPHTWDQPQVTEASHYVVLAARTEINAADIDRLLERTAEVRGQPASALAGYRQMMVGSLLAPARQPHLPDWAARQTYIALGHILLAAAQLGIDTCPIEGLDSAKYDEILDLRQAGYATVAAVAFGYRSEGDKYATLPKVRFPKSEVVKTL